MRQGVELARSRADGTKIQLEIPAGARGASASSCCPRKTYVKGFLRSYAEYLGLDGQLYVDEYNSRYIAGEEEGKSAAPSAGRTRQSQAHRQRRVERRPAGITLAGIAAIAALVIVAAKFSGNDPQQQGSPPGQRPPASPPPAVASKP